jgi:hypothetical protein
MRRSKFELLIILAFVTLALAGCGASKNGAGQAIENYLKALVAKNTGQAVSLSCASWESGAQTDADSFGAVTAILDGLSCQESGKNGNKTLVTCKGTITTTYNNENTVIDLSARTYMAAQEDNQWRMCGYK